MKVEIISATRHSSEAFWTASALGRSLSRLSYDKRIVARIFASNTRGLPLVYNECIAAAAPENLLVMVHDDVWIDDYFLGQRVTEGLNHYDVIGIAGNRRRLPRQPAWAFIDEKLTWDERTQLSGAAASGKYPFGRVAYFGESPADCELLDGVFLAARKSVLTENNMLFDARFDFHFYDMDFCRSARLGGLRLGTWPISMTHQSAGAFGTPDWLKAYHIYLAKWGS